MAKKLYYKIGEACKILEIQPYVLRYWEKEFPLLSPNKSKSGQRVYSERELEIIRRIKELLYEEGYTIAGAKKKLEGEIAEDGEPAGNKGAETKDAKDDGKAEAKKSSSEKPSSEKAAAKESAEKAEAEKAAAKGSAEKSPAKSAGPAAAGADGTEEAAKLRSGVEEALTQAREILELVGARSK